MRGPPQVTSREIVLGEGRYGRGRSRVWLAFSVVAAHRCAFLVFGRFRSAAELDGPSARVSADQYDYD
jgi:hypothetical protein